MKTLQDFITRIPDEYRDEFIRDIYKENLFRALICAILLIIAETVIFEKYSGRIFNTESTVLSIIIFNMVCLPILYIAYKKADSYNRIIIQAVQLIYITGMLLLVGAMSVIPQNEFASINTYIMAVFGAAAILTTSPIESMILYFSVYLAFFYTLPYYQANHDIVVILRINAFIMNVIAWILSRLVFRMKVVSFIDKKVIEEKNLILKDMANRDAMTSLLNHDNTYIKLGEEIERAKRIGYQVSVIMMDIDEFKYINDNYGHQVGDEVIIKVAQILVDTCRSTDIICRYGGEEFSIIMPNTGLKEAVLLSERIRTSIEKYEFANCVHITVSGGIIEFNGESVEELIERADQQLYSAKSHGKNRFETAELIDN